MQGTEMPPEIPPVDVGEAYGYAGYIIAILASAVAFLYRSQVSDLKQTIKDKNAEIEKMETAHTTELSRLDVLEATLRKEVDDCRRDREELRVQVARQQVQLDNISKRVTAVEEQK